MPLEFLPLRFDYADLAPAMTTEAARHHHDVVHGAYLDAINRLLVPHPDLAALTIEELLAHPERIPAAIRHEVRHEGGGHGNHQFMWKILGPARGTKPSPALDAALARDFGGFDAFKAAFNRAALALDGDGWAFLSLARPRAQETEIVVTRGNGNVLELKKPGVLICDLWDHAWAGSHANRAAWLGAYLAAVDWEQVSIRYELLVQGISPP